MKLRNWCILIFLSSVIVRLYFNFSQELIPGINGGYYPLQVRSLLTNGHLGFSDTPLLFYLNAFVVKVISFFGTTINDNLILLIIKLTDSILFPLLVIPFYKILSLKKIDVSVSFSIAILLFVTLSFQPLILISDLQKNSLAILFALFCMTYVYFFLEEKIKIHLFYSALFLILTGLTHFGTFIFCVIYVSAILVFYYKSRAIVPLLVLISLTLGLVAIIDRTRFLRLISLGDELFEHSALFSGMIGPPEILNTLIAIVLGVVVIKLVKKHKNILSKDERVITISSTICLLAFSFPLLEIEYYKRLSLFSFILEAVIIIMISKTFNKRQLRSVLIALICFSLISIAATIEKRKTPTISENAYEDLKRFGQIINPDKDNSIIIARHGLEWWTAWALNIKVAQEKAIDEKLLNDYQNIFVLNQISDFSADHERTPFHEPLYPQNSLLVYSSDYFKAYKWTK